MKHLTASKARRWAGVSLVLAAAGIVVQITGGAKYPAVPPGLLILVAAAALVLLAPWRWALVLAAAATAFISVGGVLAPSFRQQLGAPGETVTFVGSVTQAVGLVLALVFCAVAIREAFGAASRTPAGRQVSNRA